MRIIISIIFLVVAYLCWRNEGAYLAGLTGAVIGTLYLLTVLAMWLFDSKSKEKSKSGDFRAARKVGFTEVAFVSCVSLLSIGLFSFVFWLGPPLALEAKQKAVSLTGWKSGSSNDLDEEPMSLGFSEQATTVGNDELLGIKIPERGRPSFNKLPVVSLVAKDDYSRSYVAVQTTYITLKTLSQFDGESGWSGREADPVFHENKNSVWLSLVTKGAQRSISYEISHAADVRLLHSLQGLSQVKVPSLTHHEGVSYVLPPQTEGTKRISYDCLSSPIQFKNLTAEQQDALELGEGFARDAVNDFSNSLREQIRELAAEIIENGAETPTEKIAAVQEYLKGNYRYSLGVEKISDKPPIENFLFHERKGYCLHFASAAVILCRELGIPARLASGYCGGTYFPKYDSWLFYSNNAHAWMEAYLKVDGVAGWVVVETTPSEGVVSAEASADKDPEPFWDESLLADEGALGSNDSLALLYAEGKWLLLTLGGLLTALFAISCCQKQTRLKARKRRRKREGRSEIEERAYMALYRKKALMNGLPMMDGDTLLGHLKWLENRESLPDFSTELLDYHYETVYRNGEENPSIEAALEQKINQWRR